MARLFLLAVALLGLSAGPVPAQYAEETVPGLQEWTRERAELGRALFNDPTLSKDRTISCRSCHDPAHAFADPRRVSIGVQGRVGTRNAPSLVNRALGAAQFWDGRAPSLEAVAAGPMENPLEMDLPIA